MNPTAGTLFKGGGGPIIVTVPDGKQVVVTNALGEERTIAEIGLHSFPAGTRIVRVEENGAE